LVITQIVDFSRYPNQLFQSNAGPSITSEVMKTQYFVQKCLIIYLA